jgi:hypothetical protein
METERLIEKCIVVLKAEVRSLQRAPERRTRRPPRETPSVPELLLRSKGVMLANLRLQRRSPEPRHG